MDIRGALERLSRKQPQGCYLPFLRGQAGALYCTVCIDAVLIPVGCDGLCEVDHPKTCPYPHYCPCLQSPTQERLDDFCRTMETRLVDAFVENEL